MLLIFFVKLIASTESVLYKARVKILYSTYLLLSVIKVLLKPILPKIKAALIIGWSYLSLSSSIEVSWYTRPSITN